MNSETSPRKNEIELDEEEIMKGLSAEGEYKRDGVYLRMYSKQSEVEYFICKLNMQSPQESFSYEGFYDRNFQRSSFGKYIYPNGDIYLGTWRNDKRDGKGIYLHSNGNVYCGNWKEGIKQDYGIQFWRPSDCPDNIQAFVGKFDNDFYHHGLYLSDIQNSFEDIVHQNQCAYNYLYLGEFNDDGTKSDDNCFMYDIKRDFIFYGKILNDRAEEGYQIRFDKNSNNFEGILYFKVSPTEDKVDFLIKPECIESETTTDIYNKCEIFMTTFYLKRNYFKEAANIYFDLQKAIGKFDLGSGNESASINADESLIYINKVLKLTEKVQSILDMKAKGHFNFIYLS